VLGGRHGDGKMRLQSSLCKLAMAVASGVCRVASVAEAVT
jgi:hypothetical protein